MISLWSLFEEQPARRMPRAERFPPQVPRGAGAGGLTPAITTAFLVAASLLLSSCSSSSPAPVYEYKESSGELFLEPERVDLPAYYVIRTGDTLVNIAFEYGLDYRELARWNGITNPNRINAGQELRLSSPSSAALEYAGQTSAVRPEPVQQVRVGEISAVQPQVSEIGGSSAEDIAQGIAQGAAQGVAAGIDGTDNAGQEIVAAIPKSSLIGGDDNEAAAVAGDVPVKTGPVAAKYAYSPKTMRQLQNLHKAAAEQAAEGDAPEVPPSSTKTASAAAPAKVRERFDVTWSWPAHGKVIGGFSDQSKGLDITGKKGDSVFAIADGKVVYVGTGVKSYGRLAIIKHKNDFLSAYAHNEDVFVSEGQRVTRGERISTIGDSGAARTMLHLEIRKTGKPFDPVQVLPPKP